MAYEEEIINGVLCYRNSFRVEFTPLSQRALTDRIIELLAMIESLSQAAVPACRYDSAGILIRPTVQLGA